METSGLTSVNSKLTKRDVSEMLSMSNLQTQSIPGVSTCPQTVLDPDVKKSPKLLPDMVVEELDTEKLTTKSAVEFLLNGTLKKKVCRYCLTVTSHLSELDQILQVAGQGVLYKVTIREMVASFHPIQAADDPNFPNKICEKCIDRTLSSYLFSQQCERSERALRNCFEDMFEKLEKLDSLEKPKKRGRSKTNPNYNVLTAAYENVIDYAEPLITIINTDSELSTCVENSDALICQKCCQKLPNRASLLNHEKQHPSTMWFHCHLCGKSFPKRFQLKRHIISLHDSGKLILFKNTDYKCQDCGVVNKDYHSHLQHIEKHKFHEVMEHLLTRKMDKLCAVCLNRGSKLVELEKMICLHGGYPEMMGDRTLYNILGSTVPEMNILHNYTGNKICEKCLNHAIIAYVFIHQTLYVRNRLDVCISNMLEKLNAVNKLEGNLFVEISQQLIMPLKDERIDDNLLVDEFEEINEDELKVDVLEDEFRIESESDSSEEETKTDTNEIKTENNCLETNMNKDVFEDEYDCDFERKILFNGIQYRNKRKYNSVDVCSEFLTFKKRKKPRKPSYKYKFTCPLCNKHFISDYFLKRHIFKHVLNKCECKLCGLVFSSKFHLYEHTKIRHILKQRTNVSCRICGRTFINETSLISHQNHHQNKQCQLCEKSFKTQRHYDSHMQRHVNKLKILRHKGIQNCSFCEKECASDNDLSVHVNKIHLQIKPYSCDMCDKQFYTESNMTQHKKVHIMYSKETCEFCKKKLKCRAALVTHVRKHIGVRPHVCQICSQDFFSSPKLDKHMKLFHGGRHCCKLCKKVFSTKTLLKKHIDRAHSII